MGMGKDFFHEFPLVRSMFQEAEDLLSLPLRKVMFDGDEETLRQTRYAQPALFLMGACVVRVMEDILECHVKDYFSYAAGHSLGEYTALYAVRALGFAQGIKMIAQRCAAMQKVQNGGMVAVLGLSMDQLHEAVHAVCQKGAACAVSNENSPVQTVVSGSQSGLVLLSDMAKDMGASKVVPLNVSGPFHCDLMQEAQDEYAAYLEKETLNDGICPVVTNVTGRPVWRAQDFSDHLARQITQPVRWVETQKTLEELGVVQCLEMGPGRVLAGLARKTVPDLSVSSVGTFKELRQWDQCVRPVYSDVAQSVLRPCADAITQS